MDIDMYAQFIPTHRQIKVYYSRYAIVVCPSGSSSCRNRYHGNGFSTSLVLSYFWSTEI